MARRTTTRKKTTTATQAANQVSAITVYWVDGESTDFNDVVQTGIQTEVGGGILQIQTSTDTLENIMLDQVMRYTIYKEDVQ